MDLKELQNILKREKSRIIFIEDGEPTMVVLPYEQYKNQSENEEIPPLPEESINPEELTLDDLPL